MRNYWTIISTVARQAMEVALCSHNIVYQHRNTEICLCICLFYFTFSYVRAYIDFKFEGKEKKLLFAYLKMLSLF
jgi:hypothetical protein